MRTILVAFLCLHTQVLMAGIHNIRACSSNKCSMGTTFCVASVTDRNVLISTGHLYEHNPYKVEVGVDNRWVTAKTEYKDSILDLSILTLNDSHKHNLSYFATEDSRPGDEVIFKGYINGDEVTTRKAKVKSANHLDHPAVPGLSGSPVYNTAGNVVGMIIATDDVDAIMVPASTIRTVMAKIGYTAKEPTQGVPSQGVPNPVPPSQGVPSQGVPSPVPPQVPPPQVPPPYIPPPNIPEVRSKSWLDNPWLIGIAGLGLTALGAVAPPGVKLGIALVKLLYSLKKGKVPENPTNRPLPTSSRMRRGLTRVVEQSLGPVVQADGTTKAVSRRVRTILR